MSEPTDVATRIATLEAQLAGIHHELAALKSDVDAPPPLASRRDVFKKLAVAGAGAAVGAVTLARPAAAADGQAITAGQTTTAETTTTLQYDSTTPTNAILKVIEDPLDSTASRFTSAVVGSASGRAVINGVVGTTERRDGYGVIGWAEGGTGVLARGTQANLRLVAEGPPGPQRPGDHQIGELVCDAYGQLWLFTYSLATTTTWRRIDGTTTGGFVAVQPVLRQYDSRLAGDAGRLAGGARRIVSIGHSPTDPTVLNFIPSTASAAMASFPISASS